MTTTTTARPSKTRRSADKGYASVGAVAQGESLPVYICNECNIEVVWATSKRTGRKYLVNVSRGYHDQRFFIGANVHQCAEEAAKREAWAAQEARSEAVAAFTAVAMAVAKEIRSAMDEGDQARVDILLAAMDELAPA